MEQNDEFARRENLTTEEGWELLESMAGSWGDMFEREGGVEKFLRELRDEEPDEA